MVGIKLQGGIGNMMFEIAFIEYAGHKYGFDIIYPNIEQALDTLYSLKHEFPQQEHSAEFLIMFKNFNWYKNLDKRFTPLVEKKVKLHEVGMIPEDGIYYDGYFQSEMFFPDREFILHLFQPSDWVKGQLSKYSNILNGQTCSIHVRRGNYVKLAHIHPPQSIEYYGKAMSILPAPDRYVVFSDDISWCKENFTGDEFVFIEDEKDYIELFLMSMCDHHVISNSSFSWWGAWLNDKPDKQVVAPTRWWAVDNIISTYVIPESWIKL